MRLLLISNSTNAGEPYLQYPMPAIKNFLGKEKLLCAFIPYAGVSISWDDYTSRVRDRFESIGHKIESVHAYRNPKELIRKADAIVVGGGNTWQLLKQVKENGLAGIVPEMVLGGKSYIGWSAGSNMACPTIKTTNDMPVVFPGDFNAFNLVPFQINPHYLDANPEGHAGETREARIEEFIELNREVYVIGLREGSILKMEDGKWSLLGEKSARLFHYGNLPVEISPGENLQFLIN